MRNGDSTIHAEPIIMPAEMPESTNEPDAGNARDPVQTTSQQEEPLPAQSPPRQEKEPLALRRLRSHNKPGAKEKF